MQTSNTDTVFPRIMARGDFFSHQKGVIIRGRRLSKVPVTVPGNWGPFLESPVNFTGPNSNIQIVL